MRKLFILGILLLSGCEIEAKYKVETTNPTATVEILFVDEDGYTMKRFTDGSNTVYYTTPCTRVESIRQVDDVRHHTISDGEPKPQLY